MGGMWDADSVNDHAKQVYGQSGLQALSEMAFLLEQVLREVWEGLDVSDPSGSFALERSELVDERIAGAILDAVPPDVREDFEDTWEVDLYNIANYLPLHE